MLKRLFDIFFSFFLLLILSPLFLTISLLIVLDSRGPVFYKQIRIGKNNKKFRLYKFRTMRTNADKHGLLTVGKKDPRVTHTGYFLRKYKLDELPQLINILKGHMSFVGPRPEVEKYVKLYNEEQIKVLSVKPGLTDIASIKYINESEILGKSDNPEKTYIEEIMPAKLELNLDYIQKQNLGFDIILILKTIRKVF